jgi:hypothetical protein
MLNYDMAQGGQKFRGSEPMGILDSTTRDGESVGLRRPYSSPRMNAHPGSSAKAADSLQEMSGPESGGCGVFAEVVAEVGQREVDVAVTCGLDQL